MQNDLSDEILMAYADDALPAPERRRVETALAHDPKLVDRLEPFILTRSALPEIFSEALTSPMPDRLVKTVMTAPMPPLSRTASRAVSGTSVLARLRAFLVPEFPSFGTAVALAAVVAAIAGAGWLAGRSITPAAGPTTSKGEAVAVNENAAYAEGLLAEALETKSIAQAAVSGTQSAEIKNTFFDKSGRVCREYGVSQAQREATVGFACRTGEGRWQIGFHSSIANATAPDASANTPAGESSSLAGLDAAIDAVKSGDVLGETEDAALIANRWKR